MLTTLGPLFHCFGNHRAATVDTPTAVDMLSVSGSRYLTLNTHFVKSVSHADDLPVGYGDATYLSVRSGLPGYHLIPVLNINMPSSACEAVARAHRAHELTGARTVKLEVLNTDSRLAVNSSVTEVARTLIADGLEVWPLITPDPYAAAELEAMGCAVIRIMGSAIGSGRGLDPVWREDIASCLSCLHVPTMADGGIGLPSHATEALSLGFDSVLLNSCLFTGRAGPVETLKHFVNDVIKGPSLPVLMSAQ